MSRVQVPSATPRAVLRTATRKVTNSKEFVTFVFVAGMFWLLGLRACGGLRSANPEVQRRRSECGRGRRSTAWRQASPVLNRSVCVQDAHRTEIFHLPIACRRTEHLGGQLRRTGEDVRPVGQHVV